MISYGIEVVSLEKMLQVVTTVPPIVNTTSVLGVMLMLMIQVYHRK